MARRFLRSVRVIVGDDDSATRVDSLYIRFRIKREATSTPAEGEVDIYNLNESNETRIRERAVRVVLEAGYQDKLDCIFDGAVRRVERHRSNLDRVTRIHVGGKTAREGAERRSIFMRTYQGTVSIRDIIRDAVNHMGLELGPLDLIPEDADEHDFTYNGSTQLMMTERLRPLGIEWYEENGVIRFSRYRMTQDDRPEGITISEHSGMIGVPTVTDDGIRVSTLLDARIQLDTRIQIESTVLQQAASGDAINERAAELDGGFWKVVELEHRGDNREGEYMTTMEGRPLN